MTRVSDIDFLTSDEMEAIDKRQSRQQSDWKAVPSQGHLVKFLGIDLVVLSGVFPPKDDTKLLAETYEFQVARQCLTLALGRWPYGPQTSRLIKSRAGRQRICEFSTYKICRM